jgi:hypothetical protein
MLVQLRCRTRRRDLEREVRRGCLARTGAKLKEVNTRRRTLETDRAQYLHDSIRALLRSPPLALDNATHSRRTGTNKGHCYHRSSLL